MNRGILRLHGLLTITSLLTASAAFAQHYYKTSVSDLTFDAKQEKLTETFKKRINLNQELSMVSARIPESAGQAYIAHLPAANERAQWWSRVPQGELLVAFNLKEKSHQKGLIDLRDGGRRQNSAQSYRFHFDPTKATPCSKEEFEKIKQRHYLHLASEHLPGTPWFRHQAGKIDDNSRNFRRNSTFDLDDTFAIFSGGRAISENLALDRELILASNSKKPDIPISEIKGITVNAIDWSEKLPEEKVKVDPLSLHIPIDQHALFAPSLKELFALIDQIENEGAPIIQSFTVRNPFRTLPSQYRSQMGLDVPEVAAKLLPIKSVAVTGGDPFYPMGTDVAVLFETDNPELLFTSLSKTIGLKAKQKGAKSTPLPKIKADTQHRGYENADRSFSSHILRHGKLIVVSNSSSQIKRLLSVTGSDALGASDEFRFFRHRYPISKDESAFIFLSDATIRRWCSPEIRIGASRRTRAAAALSELNARLLDKKPIGDTFAPLLGASQVIGSTVASEHFGRLGFITPVSELNLQSATASEAEAYQQWRRGYESGWAQVFDPIAIQLKLGKQSQSLDITVLPLTVDSDYEEMINTVGDAKLSPIARSIPKESLLYFALALDKYSDLFKEFDQSLVEMLPGLKINPLSWVGESISVHLEDGFFWKAVQHTDMNTKLIGELPIAIRIESSSKIKLALFLTALKGMVDTSAPDLIRYEKRKHGKKSYVAILSDEEEMDGIDLSIFYAALPGALLVSLDEDILKRAIDRELQDINTLPAPIEARHCLFESSPQFLLGLRKILDDTSFDQRRQHESWRALPILNEWHRRFPQEKPENIHQRTFASALHCPGGKGYRWNKEAMTMESIAYGSPGAPLNQGKPIELLAKFNNLQTSFGFEDGGVRVKAKLEKKTPPKSDSASNNKQGRLLGTAKELSPKAGTISKMRLTIEDERTPNTIQSIESTILSSENGKILIENTLSDDDKILSKWISTSQIRKDGLYQTSIERDTHTIDYHDGYLYMPTKLTQGDSFKTCQTADFIESEKTKKLLFEQSKNIIGLETITVPAGKFADCIKVITRSQEILDDHHSKRTTTEWYKKNIGTVKIVTTREGQTVTYELVSKTTPEK